ncbi:hypothetical protein N7468_010368 [Penicillium chermesinum]|uniref:Protein kinase domain-containing protein n=1 Tax=Penicillium chermesinum TaxID=63820 RepID=A0A9W9NCK1_9EURO|nr:uncharacterized protein N7468_010368 [Penicillium chermesinum]KAJ5217360.1 hypothetical protein N7468_010368 [Penicillium chermesinum]
MSFHNADALEQHNWIGGGLDAYIYRVTPTIVVKTVRRDRTPEEKAAEHPFLKEISFYKRLNACRDQCPNIVECNRPRFYERQERETGINGFYGRLIRVKEFEDPALIARWIQQITSALENFNLKLTDFGRATTIGQPLEGTLPPRARPILAGPLKGTYGLCSARTEQFAVGTLLYFMVYGHEPYDDIILSAAEWDRRFWEMEFPELSRNKVFDGLISACWHNVYPTMALLAYDFKRKTKDMIGNTEYIFIDSVKETKTCEALIRKGLLGPELALRFQPAWRRYLHAIVKRSMFIWQYFVQRRFWIWS